MKLFSLPQLLDGGAVIAVLGVYCVVGVGKPFQITSGMWLIFIAMLTFAASIFMMRKLTERIDPFSATIYSTLIGSGETQTEAIMGNGVSEEFELGLVNSNLANDIHS